MRELITIEFIDHSSYSDNNTNDVVGLVMPHNWGPVDKLTPLDYSTFMSLYPEVNSPGWIKASQAYQAGAGMLEIVRPSLNATYQQLVVTESGFVFDATNTKQFTISPDVLKGQKALAIFSLLYPGSPAPVATRMKVNLTPDFGDIENPTSETMPVDVNAIVEILNDNGVVLESHEGKLISTEIEDGESVNICDILRKKSYYVRCQIKDVNGLLEREKIKEDKSGVTSLQLQVAQADKESFEAVVPEEYRTKPGCGFDESLPSLPWVVVKIAREAGTSTPIQLKLKVKGKEGYLQMSNIPESVGSLSDDKTTLTTTAEKYVMFEVANDLGVTDYDSLTTKFEAEVTIDEIATKLEESDIAVNPEVQPDVVNSDDVTLLSAEVPGIGLEQGQVTESELVDLYNRWFSSMETSRSTLIIPTISSELLNNCVIAIALKRSDCLAIVGYPTDSEHSFDKEKIKEFYQKLTKEKWGIFYAGRSVVTIGRDQVADDCIGAIAGRYCSVAASETINQLPSAQSYGAFPGTLLESLTSSEVLELQELGINSVYSAYTGPQIWGLKTMFTRQKSYWAKANVMRVVAYILSSTMEYSMSLFHTPNSASKRMLVQMNRQTVIDNLIGQEVLRNESTVICDDSNNYDAVTNGGELLIMDFDLWFVKLIERIHIRITASDTTTTAVIS